jgi:23S rRNA (guanine745-N1)-methyltransferase
MKKKEISAAYLHQHESIFQCPICSQAMTIIDLKSLVCSQGHTFDIAKQGYLNLLTHPLNTHYDKELFDSRRIIAESGFFDPLNEVINELIQNHIRPTNRETLKLLDTGCGEGSNLAHIVQRSKTQFPVDVLGTGIDIAKEGIMAAAKTYANMIWCVADLARSPFQEHTFDCILNILSPANYGEFNRLLTENGLIIKVFPQNQYLKELREVFYEEEEKQLYSNEKTLARFRDSFQIIDQASLHYDFPLSDSLIPHLIRMTPLSWSTSENRIETLLKSNLSQITVAFDILVGKGIK